MAVSPLRADDPTQVGRYRLLQRLGAGGMGVVYLARPPGGEYVALKLLRTELCDDAEFLCRFEREVRAAAAVRSPWTVPVRDFSLSDHFLVTDYVAGPTLADLVAREGPLPPDRQLTLAVGLSEALIALAGAGIVHRDLKPANVLCGPEGPRVIDFGIAAADEATTLTRAGVVLGTPQWLAQEQIRGQEVSSATDIHAAAAVLVFAATGHGPYGEGSPAAVMHRILHEPPNLGPPGALHPRLTPLVMAALSPDPAKRPTPEQFRKQPDDPPEQISDATVPVEVPDPTLPVRTQSMAGSHRRRRLLTVATCLVIAAAIVSAGTLWLTGASAPSASEQTALTCTADATPRPTHWNPAGVSVKTASGAAVTTIAHYKTTDSTRTAVADDQGRAFTEYNLGGATSRYQVQVDVTVTKDSEVGKCATSFTPR